mgnify:CR=1 FL=1
MKLIIDIPNIIQERYGNDGYAVLYKNYEQFCLRDRQFIDFLIKVFKGTHRNI